MLIRRTFVAIIGIPILILFSYLGGSFLLALIIVLSILAIHEFKELINRAGYNAIQLPLFIAAILVPATISYYSVFLPGIIFLYLFFTAICYLLKNKSYSFIDLALSYMGFLYIVIGFSHLLMLRELHQGFWLIMYLFIIVWSTDTFAYLIGTRFGQRKLAPEISPKKTKEGMLAGLFCSFITVLIFLMILDLQNSMFLIFLAPVVSFSGQLGDLFESTIKRFSSVKDSGAIIPGHGGVLDRFDSIIWAAPLTYYAYVIFERMFG